MDPTYAPTEKNTALLQLDVGADIVMFEDMQKRVDRFLVDRVRHLIVDLDGAPTIKSAALAFLVDLNKQCARRGVSLTLVNVSDGVKSILRLTRLDLNFCLIEEMAPA